MTDTQHTCLIILGGGVRDGKPDRALTLRIDTAEKYLREHPDVPAIATGGCCRRGQTVSEARVIKNELVQRGIDCRRIVLEEQAGTTYQNFELSKPLLPQSSSVIFVTNKYHTRRARLLAHQHGIDAKPLAAANPPFALYAYLREGLTMLEVAARYIFRHP